eukprot:TRINITY_DN34619_c0_g1_i1.p1 TRINITY_DN34619_c0_g1~~TRINITY_DN34619_c0_g1_i1.p1  ORF type:complete len:189 (+),score=83.18 TRINITY_DN34619_c0_g1_i1:60-569(+)
MGNCGSTPGVAKTPDAPVPKLDAKILGLSTREANAAGRFKTLQENYTAKKEKLLGDDKRSAEEKTDEGCHKTLLEDKEIQTQMNDVITDLDRELQLQDKAKKVQAEMMQEMGDDNPDNKVPDAPGASQAWEKAKSEANKKAVTEACKAFLGQELLQASKKITETTAEVP